MLPGNCHVSCVHFSPLFCLQTPTRSACPSRSALILISLRVTTRELQRLGALALCPPPCLPSLTETYQQHFINRVGHPSCQHFLPQLPGQHLVPLPAAPAEPSPRSWLPLPSAVLSQLSIAQFFHFLALLQTLSFKVSSYCLMALRYQSNSPNLCIYVSDSPNLHIYVSSPDSPLSSRLLSATAHPPSIHESHTLTLTHPIPTLDLPSRPAPLSPSPSQ